jgi:predicted ArsR family transcriptional regulator
VVGRNKPERILEKTRGRVVALLREGGKTADELAAALGITDNAVRAHLATLERDGLVQAGEERRDGRVGKPATIYHIAPDAEPLFSQAYLPLLTSLLAELGERLPPEQLDRLLANVGGRLASGIRPPSGNLRQRVQAASKLLNQLGGLSSVEEVVKGARFVINSRGCPVAAAVSERPEVCEAIVTLLSILTGAEVRSCCTRGDRPSCCFEVAPGSSSPSGAGN